MTPPRTVRDIITPRAISQSLGILEIKRRFGEGKRNPTQISDQLSSYQLPVASCA